MRDSTWFTSWSQLIDQKSQFNHNPATPLSYPAAPDPTSNHLFDYQTQNYNHSLAPHKAHPLSFTLAPPHQKYS